MKWIFLVCIVVTNTLFAQKIKWEEDKKLSWSNFKSNINRQRGTNVVAYTNCGWIYSVVKSNNPKSPVKIKVETFFNEDKSWKDVKQINDYVLNHEQKHFDIAEVFARKLRREIANNIETSGDYNKKFQRIYNRILKEYTEFQMNYDKETEHGMNKDKQTEYNILISEELENLKSYQIS